MIESVSGPERWVDVQQVHETSPEEPAAAGGRTPSEEGESAGPPAPDLPRGDSVAPDAHAVMLEDSLRSYGAQDGGPGPTADAAAAGQAQWTPPPNTRGRYEMGPGLDAVAAGSAALEIGHGGPAVSQLQEMLNAAGIEPPLEVDGLFGPKTQAALRRLQQQNGLAGDGALNAATLEALRGGARVSAGGTSGGAEPGAPAAQGTTPEPRAPAAQEERAPGSRGADGAALPRVGARPAEDSGASGAPVPTDQAPPNIDRGSLGKPAREMSVQEALAELDRLGVSYERASDGRMQSPVRLNFPINGVDFPYYQHDRSRSHVMDPRTAVALAHTAQYLGERGVTRVLHAGVAPRHRTGAHGSGRAIDIAGFEVRGPDGRTRTVMVSRDWRTGRNDSSETPRDGGRRVDRRQTPEERARMTDDERFLRETQDFLRTEFTGVTGPADNRAHWDHFHCGVTTEGGGWG